MTSLESLPKDGLNIQATDLVGGRKGIQEGLQWLRGSRPIPIKNPNNARKENGERRDVGKLGAHHSQNGVITHDEVHGDGEG